jgi:hypothetical protein
MLQTDNCLQNKKKWTILGKNLVVHSRGTERSYLELF